MCGESGHGAGLGWADWLTGRRVLNLPFNNSLMNPSRLLPVSLQSELGADWHTMNSDSQVWWVFPALIWQNLDALYFFVVYRAGSQASYQPWCCLSWFLSQCSPEGEEGLMRNVISFDSNFPEDRSWVIVTLLPWSKPLEKCNISPIRQVIAGIIVGQMWYGGHQSRQAKLTLMMGSTSRLCHGSWIQKDFFNMMFKQMSAVCVAMWMPLCFIFHSRKWKRVTAPHPASICPLKIHSLNQFSFALIKVKIQKYKIQKKIY